MGFGLTKKPRVTERFNETDSSFLFHATWKNGMAVVVKQLHPGSVISSDEVADMREKRYWQEFKFHRSLKHPNIVELLECYWNDGDDEDGVAEAQGVWKKSLHLVFPLFPLGSLGDVLQRFRFLDPKTRKHVRPEHESYAFYRDAGGSIVHACSPQFIHSTLLQISRALDFLHYRDTGFSHVIHRDLKTENVLLEALPNGGYAAKLTDFGLARHFDRMTRTAGLKSTMQISAPEMHSSVTPKYDLKVDVYAFGHLIWEVLALQKPFSNLKNATELDGLIKDWNAAKRRLDDEEKKFHEDKEAFEALYTGDAMLPKELRFLEFLTGQHEKEREKLRGEFKEAGDKARPSPIEPPLPHHLCTSEFGQQLVLSVMQRCLRFNPTERPRISDIKDMLESLQPNTPELMSAPERSVVLETLGALVKRKYAFPSPERDHAHFVRTLRKNDSLLAECGCGDDPGRGYLLPRLDDETDEAYKAAAIACERTIALPQAQAGAADGGWDRKCLSGMLVLVRNLVTHCEEKAYLHEIGWDKARLRYELGNRFAKLAVSLAAEIQKARAEAGDDVQAIALQLALDSIAALRRQGDIQS